MWKNYLNLFQFSELKKHNEDFGISKDIDIYVLKIHFKYMYIEFTKDKFLLY